MRICNHTSTARITHLIVRAKNKMKIIIHKFHGIIKEEKFIWEIKKKKSEIIQIIVNLWKESVLNGRKLYFIICRLRQGEVDKLMYLTEQFTWEDMPVKDEQTARVSMAGAVPKIQRVVRVLILVVCGPHTMYMIYRALSSRDLLGFNSWFPFDTRSSPVHELLILYHVC